MDGPAWPAPRVRGSGYRLGLCAGHLIGPEASTALGIKLSITEVQTPKALREKERVINREGYEDDNIVMAVIRAGLRAHQGAASEAPQAHRRRQGRRRRRAG